MLLSVLKYVNFAFLLFLLYAPNKSFGQKTTYTTQELSTILFEDNSVVKKIFDNMFVSKISNEGFRKYYNEFSKMLRFDKDKKKYITKYASKGKKLRKYWYYQGRPSIDGNLYILTYSLSRDEFNPYWIYNKKLHKDDLNFVIKKGETDKVKLFGKSKCSEIINSLKKNNMKYYVMDKEHWLIIDLSNTLKRDDLKNLNLVLRFEKNELKYIKIESNYPNLQCIRGEHKEKLVKIQSKNFCIDEDFFVKKSQKNSLIKNFTVNTKKGNVLDFRKGVCLTGCDNKNGEQLIHYGQYIYKGKVKNGIVHQPNKLIKVGVLKNKKTAPINLTAQYEFDKYEYITSLKGRVINGFFYEGLEVYDSISKKGKMRIKFKTLNDSGYIDVVTKNGSTEPVDKGSVIYVYHSLKKSKENIMYIGNLNDDYQPKGFGYFLWHYRDLDTNKNKRFGLKSIFENGKPTKDSLQLITDGITYSKLEKFKKGNNGKPLFWGNAVRKTIQKNTGEKYIAIGKYESAKPIGKHRVWLKQKENNYKEISSAIFSDKFPLQLSGPELFNVKSAHKYFSIDSTRRIRFVYPNPRNSKSLVHLFDLNGIMPYTKYAKKQSNQSFYPLRPNSNGELYLKKMKPKFIHQRLDGKVYIGNNGKKDVKYLFFMVQPLTSSYNKNTTEVIILGEKTVRPGRYINYNWGGTTDFGTRLISGNGDKVTTSLLPYRSEN